MKVRAGRGGGGGRERERERGTTTTTATRERSWAVLVGTNAKELSQCCIALVRLK